MLISVRSYGAAGRSVIVVHGGPGAPGTMAPVARELSSSFRVIEPLQRRSDGAPLTVARHVADLDDVVQQYCAGEHPVMIGSSWGAMLCLAYAAAHPYRVGPLILVGCGTWDVHSRQRLAERMVSRIDARLRAEIDAIHLESSSGADQQLAALGQVLLPAYSHELLSHDLELTVCDARGYRESWDDMLAQQASGFYPAAFSVIRTPVLMLHGTDDPHPGDLIHASLAPYISRLTYKPLSRCGHYPWLERHARDEFFVCIRDWILQN